MQNREKENPAEAGLYCSEQLTRSSQLFVVAGAAFFRLSGFMVSAAFSQPVDAPAPRISLRIHHTAGAFPGRTLDFLASVSQQSRSNYAKRHASGESENTPANRGEVQLERMNHEVNKRTSYREWYLTKPDIAGNFQTFPINIRTRSLATSR